MKQETEPIKIDKIGLRIDLDQDLFTLVADLAQVDDISVNTTLIKIIKSYFKEKG